MPEEHIPTFIPRNDTVIVRRVEIGWSGGLVRPATASTKYELYSVVVAVGPKVEDLEPGARVVGIFAGAVPIHTTLPIYAMSEDVVIAKVEGGEGIEAVEPKKESRVVPVRGPLPSTNNGRKNL